MDKCFQTVARGIIASVALSLLGTFGLATALHADQTWKVLEIDGVFEYATGPEDLARLSMERPVTPRTLMAYGRLPSEVVTVALALRPQGVDLLAADLDTLRALYEKARAGEIDADEYLLGRLATNIATRQYLDWEEIRPEQEIRLGDDSVVRGRGELILADSEGARARLLLAGETVPAGRISWIEAPLWAQEPALRTFRSPGYVRARVELPLDAGLVAMVPAGDGGQLAAVTVLGHAGPQTVFMRRNAAGRLLWSAMPTAGTHLLPEVMLPLGTSGYLVAGAGPVVRFDDEGARVWTSDLTEQAAELAGLSVTAGAVRDQTALLAGGVAEPAAVWLVAVDADGRLAWRRALPDFVSVRHVVALGAEGWAVAGEAADGKPWLAVLDAQGESLWRPDSDTSPAPSRIEALAAAPQGPILLAGQQHGGGLWLNKLDPASGQLEQVTLSGPAAIPALNGVHVLAFDADGQLLIGGEARTENAWLARMAIDGRVAWSHEYGTEPVREALLDVMPAGDSLVVLGRLHSGSRRTPPEVWLMQVDAEGRPAVAPELPAEVLAFETQLRKQLEEADPLLGTLGSPEFHVDGDGAVHLAIPWLTIESDWAFQRFSPDVEWVVGDVHARLGTEEAGLQPIGLSLPLSVEVRDPQGGLAGRLSFAQTEFSGQWDVALGTLRNLRAGVEGALLDLHPQDGMMGGAGAEAALARMEGRDAPRSLAIDRLALTTETRRREDGLHDLPLRFTLENIELASFIEQPLFRLGQLSLDIEQRDVALESLLELARMGEAHGLFQNANPVEMFTALFGLFGNPSVRFEASGLNVRGEHEQQYLRVDSVKSDLGLRRAEADAERRDLWGRFSVEGLDFGEGDDRDMVRFELQRLGFNAEIDAISPMAIVQVALASVFAGEVSEPELLALSQQMFSRVLLALEAEGFQGLEEGSQDQPQPFGADALRLRSEATDLNTPAPSWSLDYLHDGVALPPVLDDTHQARALVPTRSELALTFERLPSGFAEDEETVYGLKTGELDPGQLIIEQMLANRTVLDLPRWTVELPGGLIALAGRVWTEEGEAESPGSVVGQFDLRIVQLDRLTAQWLAAVPDDKERRDLESLFAMLRILGEERDSPDGDSEHVFRIDFDSSGRAQVNGEDLTPLLGQLDGRG